MASLLIVDDEEAIRTFISAALMDHLTCYLAGTVEEALEHLKAEGFDVVITDISMPGISGLELLGHIRQTHPDTPVIVMSGIADEGHALGLIKMGAFHYLIKPFEVSQLQETIEAAVKYRQEKRSLLAEDSQAEVPATGMDSDAELIVLERQWAEAYRRRNLALLDRIWAEDFALTTPFGGTKQKERALAMIRSEIDFEFFVTFDRSGQVFGETAVATGRAIVKGEYKRADISGEYKFTNTYAKRQETWQAISSHLTQLEQI